MGDILVHMYPCAELYTAGWRVAWISAVKILSGPILESSVLNVGSRIRVICRGPDLSVIWVYISY